MPHDPSPQPATAVQAPTTTDLQAALRLLQYPADPATITADTDPTRQVTALWEHVATWATHQAHAAARHAGLTTDDRIDLRYTADSIPTTIDQPQPPAHHHTTGNSPATTATQILSLQQHRLTTITHAILAVRGPRLHPLADACLSTLDATHQLLGTWRTAQPTHIDEHGNATAERVQLAPLQLAIHRLSIAHQILTTATHDASPTPP